MNNPWGLSGPEFLWLYGTGLVVTVAWAVAVRMRARRPRMAEPPPVLDLESVAFLAGGARRLLELSIARLTARGFVRINRRGTIKAVASGTEPTEPLDVSVLNTLGGRSPLVSKLIRDVNAVDHMDRVAGTLTRHSLLISPEAVAKAKRWSLVPTYLLLVVGVVRLLNGAAGGYPVGYLVIELGVTVLALIVLHKRRIRPRTVHGDRALKAARPDDREGFAQVALGGLRAFPDEEVRDALAKSARIPAASTAWTYGGGGIYATCSSGAAAWGGGGYSGGGGDSGGGASCCGGGGGCGGGGSS
jgi:uncharacterized protein (TIGR04222 family)